MGDLLSGLRKFDALRDGEAGGDEVHRRVVESIAPVHAEDDVLARLGKRVRTGLQGRGIERLYQHQSDAVVQALEGKNVVLQAPTASGKTLAFLIPMLEAVCKPGAHALMIYPTKALALDQRDQLSRLTNAMPGPKIESWWYDGDTDREHRTVLRKNPPPVLITNPDMLHNSFLGHSEQWSEFYKGLKWVIVDEMHEYRGYFGSNVSMILRRFSYHLASLGVRPQFFLSSATCANAREHAENLTGLEFVEVNASSAMRPQREFVFVQPDIPAYQYWEILQVRTVLAGLACVADGKSVLAFCPTRRFAEACYPIAMRELEKREEKGMPLVDRNAIKVFRAGLSVEERHAVQEGLKRGDVRLVFTTNALEMGIDIGGLDGIIMAGFPDSLLSAWQRIGRAGRAWDAEAFVLYFARNNPLDRFYAANLDTCLTKPLDDLVVNPENEDLVEKHLGSLLYETPELSDDVAVLGPAMETAARAKIEAGVTPVKSGRWRPHHNLNIRGGGAGMFVLKDGNLEIGTMSGLQQFREAYLRAIYMHGGRGYRVKEVALTGSSGGEILLESADPSLRTRASTFTFVQERDIFAGWRWVGDGTDVTAFHGKVLITESLNSVQEVNDRGEVLAQWVPQSNSAQFSNAHAFWIQEQHPTEVSAAAINAFQQLLRVGALFTVPLDAHDIFPHAVAQEQKAYIVESYPGGIGIAKKILDRWRGVLEVGARIATACTCAAGCPNCIVPPRATDEMDKMGALRFAEVILRATEREPDGVFRDGLWMPN